MTALPPDGAQAVPQAAPVCPRHPNREAYVRCQRCERPTCPECQRPAAVGIQCVDCVREGAKSVRTARTVLGGRAGVDRPVVTQTIIGLCVVLLFLQYASSDEVTSRLAFWNPVVFTEPWRFLTSGFLHGGILHIALNMYALWMIGPYLEQLFGRVRFAGLYLVSIVGGSVGYFVLSVPNGAPNADWWVPTVGASGAVFGLFAALVVVNRRLNRDIGGVVGIIAINLVIGFLPLLGVDIGVGIAWQAHVGGLLTGAALAAGLAYAPRERQQLMHVLTFAGVAVLLVVLVLVKAATVPAGLLA